MPSPIQIVSNPQLKLVNNTVPSSVYDAEKGRLGVGRVIKAIPYVRGYEVYLFGEHLIGYMAGGGTNLSAGQGNTDISTLASGVHVLCFLPANSDIITIIGSVPIPVDTVNNFTADFMFPQAGIGICENIYDREFKKNYGIRVSGEGMPGDALPGDWGVVNALGLKCMVSQFTTAMSASDNCGVWAFYMDQLLRIAGRSMQIWTAGLEHTIYEDEGEIFDVEYRAKYPWEALGMGSPEDAFKDEEPTWEDDNLINRIEPKEKDQVGIWRSQIFRGYLGDMYKECIALPKEDLAPNTYTQQAEDPVVAGLSDITHGADGSVSIRSAKEIVLIKYPLIPVPQQKTTVDDHHRGDWHENYKASNEFGKGPDADPQDAWEWSDEPGEQSAYLLDYLAYKFNKYHLGNFIAHENDWFVPEEEEIISSDIIKVTRGTIAKEKITVLQDNYWADQPELKELDIDDRLPDAKFYESMSCISMLDDGTVTLEDGWGSQIIMSRGNIMLSPAGNLELRPGKSIVGWSGGDLILRSGKSVDITSATEDVRIKAEHNMHILAGNDDSYGGILLESRSKSMAQQYNGKQGTDIRSNGIVLKAADSAVLAWGKDIALQSLDGRIVLDAGEGKEDIFIKAKSTISLLEEFSLTNFSKEGASDSSVIYNSRQASITTAKNMLFNGNMQVIDGSIICNGTIGGKQVVYDGKTPTMLMGADKAIEEAIRRSDNILSDAEETMEEGAKKMDEGIKEYLLKEKLHEEVGFSLRTPEQYDIPDDFKIFAARWQQYLNGDGETWEEPVVESPEGTETLPHPGKKWQESVYYPADNLVNFDLEKGHAKSREEYSFKTELGDSLSPESAYKILVRIGKG